MAEKSIIFSAEMVRAILNGKKSVTRQVIKPPPPEDTGPIWGPEWYEPAVAGKDGELNPGKPIYGIYDADGEWGIKCPYPPGTVLWVRETWAYITDNNETFSPFYVYRADGDGAENYPLFGGWKPSIQMPRNAARLFLRVANVRVERVRDISDEDIAAEGIVGDCYGEEIGIGPTEDKRSARIYFADFWDSLSASRGYPFELSPYVWVVSFEVMKDATS